MKPTGRRRLAGYFQEFYGLSERRACSLAPINRKVIRYEPQRSAIDAVLVARMKQLAEQYPRYGYLMLHELLRREDLVVNSKRTYRIYCDLGLQVRTRRRKKLTRPRIPLEVPRGVNERWSLDFVHDQLAESGRVTVLNIVDDFPRVCVGQLIDLPILEGRMAPYLDKIG